MNILRAVITIDISPKSFDSDKVVGVGVCRVVCLEGRVKALVAGDTHTKSPES